MFAPVWQHPPRAFQGGSRPPTAPGSRSAPACKLGPPNFDPRMHAKAPSQQATVTSKDTELPYVLSPKCRNSNFRVF